MPDAKILRMGSTRPKDEEVAVNYWLPELMKRDKNGKVVHGRAKKEMAKIKEEAMMEADFIVTMHYLI